MESNYLMQAKKYLNELVDAKDMQTRRLNEIGSYGDVILKKRTQPSGTAYYYAQERNSKALKYLGKEGGDTINLIKEYRWLKESLSAISSNIAVMEKSLGKLKATDYESINSLLPSSYKDPRLSGFVKTSMKADNWKKQAEALKERSNVYMPEELKIKTNDGNMVRSKSEALIYNYLLHAGVNFVYELPLRLRNRMIIPDFTLLSEFDYQTEILIEHQGMIGNVQYRNKFAEKMYQYLREGYVQGVNIFYTFDNVDGGLDMTPVEDLVRYKVKQSAS